MARLITAFLFIAIVIYGSSCSNCTTKTVQCPAYDNANFAAWFPYHDSEQVVFKTSSGIPDTLFIQTVTLSGAYVMKGIGYTSASCIGSANIAAPSSTPSAHNVYLTLQDIHSYSGSSSTNITFDSVIINALTIADTGINLLTTYPSTSQHWSSRFSVNTSFNGKVYDSLQKIYAADATSATVAGIDTLYLAKNFGIIGFSKYPAHAIYAIQ